MITRRDFLAAAALGAAGCRASSGGARRSRGRPIYVGTYTKDTGSRGIYLARMDDQSGMLRLDRMAADTANPSFLTPGRNDRFLYAVNELTEFDGQPAGGVSAFERNPETGVLTLLSQRSSRGGAPCYVSLDRSGWHVLVANYVGGSVAVFPIELTGAIGAATAFVQHAGHGADPKRQSGPHAHCIMAAPDNRFVLVADLGLDELLVYAFDARLGTLSGAPVTQGVLAPGAGPRHFDFHPSGRLIYVANELNSTVTVMRYEVAMGALAELQTLPAMAEPSGDRNAPADIHVHPSGRFLYLSNRGPNSISVFAIDGETGRLSAVQQVPTGGNWPRNFALDPSGRFLYVANQRSNSIVGFRVDEATGQLTPTGQTLEVPAPVCISFA